ncbi:MAG: hypothetical protein IPI43_12850 [Sandaracinaceae bacterium]|nr:hypothetical protein [Sandaracinaceae bacterium]
MVMHERLAAAVERAFRTLPRGVPLLDELVHVFGLLLRTYGEAPPTWPALACALGTASGPNGRRMAALTYSFLHQLGGLVPQPRRAAGGAGHRRAGRRAEPLRAVLRCDHLVAGRLWHARGRHREAAAHASLALQLRGLAH